jgi:glutamate dehydrogenase
MPSKPIKDNAFLSSVLSQIEEKFPKTRAADITLFVSRFYASTPKSELAKRSTDELLEAALQAWEFLNQRSGPGPKIEFEHLHPEQGSLQSAATKIYILVNDMPFIVDSIRQAVNRCSIKIKTVNNTVVQVLRGARSSKTPGQMTAIKGSATKGYKGEALCCVTCGLVNEAQFSDIEKELRDTLKLVAIAVKDYRPICERAESVRERFVSNADSLPVSLDEVKESSEFIQWLLDNHFTFLGYEEYRIKKIKGGPVIELQKDSKLGISKYKSGLKHQVQLKSLPKGTADVILKKQICGFAKSSIKSKVHRSVHLDYVLIKEFDSKGNLSVEHRFVGLYTSSVYYQTALDIPLIRKKVNSVLEHSGFSPNGHSIKDLLQVINVFPRDELFQSSLEQLFSTALEITQIQETRTSKLFIRKDSYGKFFSCLVYMPRDIYNTRVRQQVQAFLKQALGATEIEFNTYLSESTLARIQFVLHVPTIQKIKFNQADLETQMIELIKPWDDYFIEALQEHYPDREADQLFSIYSPCYSAGYKETYTAEEGVKDIQRVAKVVDDKQLGLDLDSCSSVVGAELSFKIFSYGHQLFLSDVAPILENLGLNIISEKAFRLKPEGEAEIWLHDFSLFRKNTTTKLPSNIEEIFESAFAAVWQQKTEDDSFNQLVIAAELPWRDVALLRAYGAYLKQIQFGYSAAYIADTLALYKSTSRKLVEYFYEQFNPCVKNSTNKVKAIRRKILAEIDTVSNLAQDSVLRSYLELMDATLRTNYFQQQADGSAKDYFSFKFNSAKIRALPLPKPMFEIFVFSRLVEGVHLRGGKVARGGLRWSDRSEDYRTEVLGLVKAQQVKNSVIVPVGAKGGFIVKQATPPGDREEYMRVGIDCYKTFISGLLDITDNIVSGNILPPAMVLRKDEDDPYLVVAADKGTATFSDIANGLAEKYGFWLGDGFASGGSNGYDHKAMGITAKGAWISVQRHFRELGKDIQNEDFTTIGIGDMSGDVFGNGMLLSKHTCLVAAFNHLHIFIDPNPDAAASFKERARLFKLPRSNWTDYESSLISKGGGVFPRSAKSIALTPQIKERFGIDVNSASPDQLISLLLKASVDLLWNGGIGTYVKASTESHSAVGDKGNDSLRVDGNELRCKVIGEGGNLGFTQLGRIEFALNGGVSLTDFIDNSAGVDCSDHEVNIKILLNELKNKDKLTEQKRRSILVSMTSEVATLVLDNNYSQVLSIGVANAQMGSRGKEFSGLVGYLEKHAGLNRKLEFLPSNDVLDDREKKGQFLTRPELSVLTSYMKMFLKKELVVADYIADDYLEPYLNSAFPQSLVKTHHAEIASHQLRKEITSTQVANSIVNLFGASFIYRLVDSSGASPSEVVKAAIIAKDIYQIDGTWAEVEALDYKVESATQDAMMFQLIRLARRTTRWLLRNRRSSLDFKQSCTLFAKKIIEARTMIPRKLPAVSQAVFNRKHDALVEKGVPESLARQIASCQFLVPIASFVEVSQSTNEGLGTILDVYYSVGEELQLNWLGELINNLDVTNYWEALARESFLDDMTWQQRALTCNVLAWSTKKGSADSLVKNWAEENAAAVDRAKAMLATLQGELKPDYSMFSVVLRELLNLAQTTVFTKG